MPAVAALVSVESLPPELSSFDAALAERAREHRMRERLERARAAALGLKDAAPLTGRNLREIRHAELLQAPVDALRRRREAGGQVTRNERQSAMASAARATLLLRGVEADVAHRTNERYLARVTDEPVELETARGEVIERQNVVTAAWALSDGRKVLDVRKASRLRITTRDGLEVLAKLKPDAEAGIIPLRPMLYAAGLRYREFYERCDPEKSLRPPPINPDERGGFQHGGDGYEVKRRAMAATFIELEKGAYDHAGGGPAGAAALHALREIAGKGLPLGRLVKGSRARKRLRADLERALQGVANRLGMG